MGALVVGFGTGGVVTNNLSGAVIGRVISQLTPHICMLQELTKVLATISGV